jgi:hypothetical protein
LVAAGLRTLAGLAVEAGDCRDGAEHGPGGWRRCRC